LEHEDDLEEDDLEEEDEIVEPFDDLLSDIGECHPNLRRSRWGNVVAKLPQDLYQTPRSAVSLLDEALAGFKGKVIYEPFNGGGAISSYLEERGFTVVKRDLYTMEDKDDYLTSIDPVYDILISNPPFCIKHEVFEKAFKSGNPFILLLPIQFLTAKRSYDNIKLCEIDIIIFNPNVKFLHDGQHIQVGESAWMLFNIGSGGGHFSVVRLPEFN
jgi:hypothetical protein